MVSLTWVAEQPLYSSVYCVSTKNQKLADVSFLTFQLILVFCVELEILNIWKHTIHNPNTMENMEVIGHSLVRQAGCLADMLGHA